MPNNMTAAIAARTLRETLKDDGAAYRAHRAYVAATVALARELGVSVTEAARRVDQAYRAR